MRLSCVARSAPSRFSSAPGCVVAVRLIGVSEAEQRRQGGEWLRNDSLVAAPARSHAHAELSAIEDIGASTLAEIEAFFTQYNRLKGVEFRVIRRAGPRRAEALAAAAKQN